MHPELRYVVILYAARMRPLCVASSRNLAAHSAMHCEYLACDVVNTTKGSSEGSVKGLYVFSSCAGSANQSLTDQLFEADLGRGSSGCLNRRLRGVDLGGGTGCPGVSPCGRGCALSGSRGKGQEPVGNAGSLGRVLPTPLCCETLCLGSDNLHGAMQGGGVLGPPLDDGAMCLSSGITTKEPSALLSVETGLPGPPKTLDHHGRGIIVRGNEV